MAYHQFGQLGPDERIEYVDEERDGEFAPARRWPAALLTVLVMAVFAGGLWFAYTLGTRHPAAPADDAVPLIRADNKPMKVKPDQPGGMDFPDRDKLIYGAPSDGSASAPPPPPSSGAQPHSPGPVAAAKPPAAPLAPAAPSPPQPAPAAGIRVQLGAMRSEDQAHQEWERLKHKNGDLLGALNETTVRADLGDKGVFFRIQAGPFADAAAANRLCDELKKRSFGCTIVR
jgi:cell division septation protein DedD